MNQAIFVLSWNEELIQRLAGQAVVLFASTVDELTTAIQAASRHGVTVHRVALRSRAPLALIPLRPDTTGLPLAMYPSGLGRMQDLVRVLPALHELNVRVYLPVDTAESCTALRVLASLGIEAAALLDGGPVAWGPLTDLMTYALLGLWQHAGIEPFQYVASRYDPQKRLDWGPVYFDDPETYLHVDAQGRVSFTMEDQRQGKFLAPSIEEVTEEKRNAAYEEHRESWKEYFLQRRVCAYCQGWRVCLGRMAARAEEDRACSAFFLELMDVVDQQKARQRTPAGKWRP